MTGARGLVCDVTEDSRAQVFSGFARTVFTAKHDAIWIPLRGGELLMSFQTQKSH
jgi:hypothetical protein